MPGTGDHGQYDACKLLYGQLLDLKIAFTSAEQASFWPRLLTSFQTFWVEKKKDAIRLFIRNMTGESISKPPAPHKASNGERHCIRQENAKKRLESYYGVELVGGFCYGGIL